MFLSSDSLELNFQIRLHQGIAVLRDSKPITPLVFSGPMLEEQTFPNNELAEQYKDTLIELGVIKVAYTKLKQNKVRVRIDWPKPRFTNDLHCDDGRIGLEKLSHQLCHLISFQEDKDE